FRPDHEVGVLVGVAAAAGRRQQPEPDREHRHGGQADQPPPHGDQLRQLRPGEAGGRAHTPTPPAPGPPARPSPPRPSPPDSAAANSSWPRVSSMYASSSDARWRRSSENVTPAPVSARATASPSSPVTVTRSWSTAATVAPSALASAVMASAFWAVRT